VLACVLGLCDCNGCSEHAQVGTPTWTYIDNFALISSRCFAFGDGFIAFERQTEMNSAALLTWLLRRAAKRLSHELMRVCEVGSALRKMKFFRKLPSAEQY